MSNVAAQAISYANPLSVPLSDGMGNINITALPNFGSIGLVGGSNSEYGGQQILLAYLSTIWSAIVGGATATGAVSGGATGSGSISV